MPGANIFASDNLKNSVVRGVRMGDRVSGRTNWRDQQVVIPDGASIQLKRRGEK